VTAGAAAAAAAAALTVVKLVISQRIKSGIRTLPPGRRDNACRPGLSFGLVTAKQQQSSSQSRVVRHSMTLHSSDMPLQAQICYDPGIRICSSFPACPAPTKPIVLRLSETLTLTIHRHILHLGW
jgi:hypothetical protein